jgi:hypothetical protein
MLQPTIGGPLVHGMFPESLMRLQLKVDEGFESQKMNEGDEVIFSGKGWIS